MNYRSEISTYIQDQGFELVRERKHLIWKNQDGLIFVCAKTPSCGRAVANIKKQLKRIVDRFYTT